MYKSRFNGLDLKQAKKLYLEEAKKCHPDKGGDKADFQNLNAEFEAYTKSYNHQGSFFDDEFEKIDYIQIVLDLWGQLPPEVVEHLENELTRILQPYKDRPIYSITSKVASSGLVSESLSLLGVRSKEVAWLETFIKKIIK